VALAAGSLTLPSSATGRSRLNVSLTTLKFNGTALPSGALLVAHLHAARCSASPAGGEHYRQNLTLPDDSLAVPPPAGSGQGSNTFGVRVPPSGMASAVQPMLVDYDRGLSVVLHEGAALRGYAPVTAGARAACCDLVPNLPDLPETYSVTIEANFGLSKAYTMVRQEYKSREENKITVVEHSNMLRTVTIQDYTKNVTYKLLQNATYPNGVCEATACRNTPLSQCNGQVQDTAALFTLGDGQPIFFDGVNLKNVRGISCERWSRNFTITTPFGNDTGVASYYFPISSWKNRGENFHRLLKRIEVVGFSRRGAFSHSYEWLNMVPAVSNVDVFNPCRVLAMGPMGVSQSSVMKGCGCDVPAQPPAKGGKMYGPGSMAALGIILPLFTLAVGHYMGSNSALKGPAAGGHVRLQDEVALTAQK